MKSFILTLNRQPKKKKKLRSEKEETTQRDNYISQEVLGIFGYHTKSHRSETSVITEIWAEHCPFYVPV